MSHFLSTTVSVDHLAYDATPASLKATLDLNTDNVKDVIGCRQRIAVCTGDNKNLIGCDVFTAFVDGLKQWATIVT